MNIILIGYRGSGKTTMGRLLAEQLWKTYADVDQEVCRRFGGMTIAAIWEQHGEPAWRQKEVQVTKELVAKPDHVIGLGGGTLMQPEAKAAVQAAPETIRIYLKCAPQELHRRIQTDTQSAATRPNLTNLGGGLEEIKAILAQREPVYLEVADKVFDVTDLDPKNGLAYLIKRCL